MNLKELINILPYYFKEHDTYKVNNKGLLERFLEICGSYFQDNITADIDNILDITNIEHTPEYYLNYLWEFLGELPFANGPKIDEVKFKQHFNGLLSEDELSNLKDNWTLPNKGPVYMTDEKIRLLLKYSVALLKIRGTKQFFEIIFKLYGFDITINDPTYGYTKTSNGCISNYNGNINDDTNLDESNFDSDYDTMDINHKCTQCIPVFIDISTEAGFMCIEGHYFRDSQSIIFGGKYDGLAGLTDLTTEELTQRYITASTSTETDSSGKIIRYYGTDQDDYVKNNEALIISGMIPASVKDFSMFRLMVENFFDKYLPYNVYPVFTYSGLQVDDGVVLYAEPVNGNTVLSDANEEVPVKVTIRSNWPRTEFKYQVCSEYTKNDDDQFEFKDWGQIHDSSELFIIRKPGNYYFKHISGKELIIDNVDGTISKDYKYSKVSVTKHTKRISYSIVILDNDIHDSAGHPTDLAYGKITPYNYHRSVGYHIYLTCAGRYTILGNKVISSYNTRVLMNGTIENYGEQSKTEYVPVSCDDVGSTVQYMTGATTVTIDGLFPVYGKNLSKTYTIYISEFPSFTKELYIETEALTISIGLSKTSEKLDVDPVSTDINISTNYGNEYSGFETFHVICLNNNVQYSNGDTFTTQFTGIYSFVPKSEHGSDFSDFNPITFTVTKFEYSQYKLSVTPDSIPLGESIFIELSLVVPGDDTPNYNVNIYEAGVLKSTVNAQTLVSYTPTTRGTVRVESVVNPSYFFEVEVTVSPEEEVYDTLLVTEMLSGYNNHFLNWVSKEDSVKNKSLNTSRVQIVSPISPYPGEVVKIYAGTLGWASRAEGSYVRYYNDRGEGNLLVKDGKPLYFELARDYNRRTGGNLLNDLTYNKEAVIYSSSAFGSYTVITPSGRNMDNGYYYLTTGVAFFIHLYDHTKTPVTGHVVIVNRWYKVGSTWTSSESTQCFNGAHGINDDEGTPWQSRYINEVPYPYFLNEAQIFEDLKYHTEVVAFEFKYTQADPLNNTLRSVLFIYGPGYTGNFTEKFDTNTNTIIG